MKELGDITGAIVDASVKIHQTLESGHLETTVHGSLRFRASA